MIPFKDDEDSLEAPIPTDWEEALEKLDYLAGVDMAPVTMHAVDRANKPAILDEDYSFQLERKVLGLL